MELYSNNEYYKLYKGNMLDLGEVIKPCSIDAVLTDPPYELNFMGKGWDNSGIAFQPDTWKRCLEALKPGGYLLAFGGSRTYHRIACAIEDAGFEIRDCIMWLYGSGFPKSMDISKQIDKRGATSISRFGGYLRGVLKERNMTYSDLAKHFPSKTGGITGCVHNRIEGKNMPTLEQFNKICEILDLPFDKLEEAEREVIGSKKTNLTVYQNIGDRNISGEVDITAPSTELAKQRAGWGTALKPSYEPIIVARKPLEGSCTDNVIKYGVGGINIDECRVEYNGTPLPTASGMGKNKENNTSFYLPDHKYIASDNGRFPANTILTYDESDFEEVCGGFPDTKSGSKMSFGSVRKAQPDNTYQLGFTKHENSGQTAPDNYGDSGNASRYFKNCDFSLRDIDQWKQLYVSNAEKSLEILSETIESIVPISADMLLGMLKDLNVKYAENQLDLGEIHIVPDIVEMLTYDFRKEGLQAILDFIGNYKNCIQLQSLVQFVEKCDNIDTTQTTQNLLKLFGYVRAAITKYTQTIKNEEQKRYIYTPKASKRDRDEGLGTETTIDIILSDKNGKIWKGENIIRDEKLVNADIEAYLKSDTGEYGTLSKEDLDLNIISYMKNIIEKYLNECKSTTKMGINSTTIYQILNWLIHLNTKENTLDVKQYDEKYISHVESAENGNLFEITIKEKSELVHDVNNAVLKMQLKIRRKEKHSSHPTVKPCDLMQYLVRLVTPNGGTVLDPFNGSGSTGKAVMYENKDRNKNYKYIGIELTEEYLPIAKARIEYVINKGIEKEKSEPKQEEQTKQRKESALF